MSEEEIFEIIVGHLVEVLPDIDHRFIYKPLKKKRYKFPFTVL